MPNFSGIWTVTQQMQAKGASTWPLLPGAPTIGTATAGGANCASVTFTAPGCTGYPAGVTGYRVVSTPGCFTQTGASSPLVVTGLTTGTSYTFKAQATNASGYGALSAASNSITAAVVTCATYTTPGTYSWVAPTGVTSVAVVAIGGGSFGQACGSTASGGGGGLGYKNNYAVTPGSSYSLRVGAVCGNDSFFVSTAVVKGGRGYRGATSCGANRGGGTYTGDGGGNGGCGVGSGTAGGGGAGGYSGKGGNGTSGSTGTAGAGGGGGGGAVGNACCAGRGGGGGGGTGLFGQGTNGAAGSAATSYRGLGGSGGTNANPGYINGCGWQSGGGGGSYGGGGGAGCNALNSTPGFGSDGAVRIVWCVGGVRGTPSFPSTNVGP